MPVAEERVQRRMTAILAADVADYARPVGADEDIAFPRLDQLARRTLRGRMVWRYASWHRRHQHDQRQPHRGTLFDKPVGIAEAWIDGAVAPALGSRLGSP
jgi:hypothetical protein